MNSQNIIHSKKSNRNKHTARLDDQVHSNNKVSLRIDLCQSTSAIENIVIIHGPGLSAECPPDGAQEIPGREETVAGEAAGRTNEDGPTFRGSTESRTEGATARGETKRLDLGVDMETHR